MKIDTTTGARIGTERFDVYLGVIPNVSWSDNSEGRPVYRTTLQSLGYWRNYLVSHDADYLVFTPEGDENDTSRLRFKPVPYKKHGWFFEYRRGQSTTHLLVDEEGVQALNVILEQYYSLLLRDDPEENSPFPTVLIEQMLEHHAH